MFTFTDIYVTDLLQSRNSLQCFGCTALFNDPAIGLAQRGDGGLLGSGSKESARIIVFTQQLMIQNRANS